MPKTALLLIKISGRFAQNQWLLMGSPQRGAMGIKKPGDIKGKRPGAPGGKGRAIHINLLMLRFDVNVLYSSAEQDQR